MGHCDCGGHWWYRAHLVATVAGERWWAIATLNIDPTIALSRIARRLLDDLADYYTPVRHTETPLTEERATQLILDALEEARPHLEALDAQQ